MGKGRERDGEAGHKGGRNEGDPDPQILAPAQSLQTGQECPVFPTCRRGNPRRKEEGDGKGGEGLQTHRQKTSIPGAAAASIRLSLHINPTVTCAADCSASGWKCLM